MGWTLGPELNAIKSWIGTLFGLPRGSQLGGTGALVTLTINTLYAIPVYLADLSTYKKLLIEVTTLQAASTLRLGIYSDLDGVPSSLLVDGGTVSSATTGMKDAAIATILPPGFVWLVVVADTAGIVVRGFRQVGLEGFLGHAYSTDVIFYAGVASAFVAGALPAAWPGLLGPTLQNSSMPSILIGD